MVLKIPTVDLPFIAGMGEDVDQSLHSRVKQVLVLETLERQEDDVLRLTKHRAQV